jgi:addiction module HigA family antidote
MSWTSLIEVSMSIAHTTPLSGVTPHPGKILRDELNARGQSPHALALALRVPTSRINQILHERRGITPDTALRLARYFGGSAAIWLRLQLAYDLDRAQVELANKIAAEINPTPRKASI